MVFGLIRPGFETTWGEHANYYTKDVISQVSRDPDIKKKTQRKYIKYTGMLVFVHMLTGMFVIFQSIY